MTVEEMQAVQTEIAAVLREGAQRNGRITHVDPQPFGPGDEPEIWLEVDGEPFALVVGVM